MGPEHAEALTPIRSMLPDGYSEYQFLEAVRTIVRACGGNRQIAQGVAIELVKQETEARHVSLS